MEKVDLFFGIMVALILALIPAALLLRDQLERRRKTGKRVKALKIIYNSVYWLAVLLFLLVGGREVLSYFDKKNANEHTHRAETANTADHDTLKKITDTIKTGVKLIPAKIDSSTDTILRSLKAPKLPIRSRAFLRLSPNTAAIPHSAIIRSTGIKDSFAISIWVANTGGYTAISISDTFFLVYFKAGNIFVSSGGVSEFLPDQEVYCNEALSMSYGMKPSQLQSVDRSLVFLKIHYTDSIGTNGLMRVMLIIYPFVPDADLHAPLPDEYYKVRNYLIANKIW
jgi:hypothetical protein